MSRGETDGFVIRASWSDGAFVAAETFGGAAPDGVVDLVALDGAGIATGFFEDRATLGGELFDSDGCLDVFVTLLDQ